MDIIIEGLLTEDDSMNDLLETIIHLKTVPNALLRLSSPEGHLKGRIGFGAGGYILGGCVDDTGELGYTAVRKLLTIKSGNYAVLDTGRELMPEVNQTLWLKGEKVLELLPLLPETPDSLLDVNSNTLTALQGPVPAKSTKVDREHSISRARFTAIQVEKSNPQQKRNIAILLSSVLLILLLMLLIILFSDQISSWLNNPS